MTVKSQQEHSQPPTSSGDEPPGRLGSKSAARVVDIVGGAGMTWKTRIFISMAAIAAISSLSNVIFVITKIPAIHWSSLRAGIFGAIVAAFFAALARKSRAAGYGAS